MSELLLKERDYFINCLALRFLASIVRPKPLHGYTKHSTYYVVLPEESSSA